MFTVQRLSGKIEALAASRVNVEEFEDWFLSESWGFYDTEGDTLSAAIAAVHHVLHAYEASELKEENVPQELVAVIRPFERSYSNPVVVEPWLIDSGAKSRSQ